MNAHWQALGTKFNNLSQRERLLVALASLSLTGVLCFTLLEPKMLAYQARTVHLKELNQSNTLASQQISLYEHGLSQDPDADYKQRLTGLEQQMLLVDAELTEQMVDMIPAEHMPTVLAKLLGKANKLTLLSFRSLTPVPLLGAEASDKLNLYSHGIKFTLEGDYFSFLTFVQSVEAMPDKLYWKHLNYRVDKHPLAKIELELYTLSINKDFISVAKQN